MFISHSSLCCTIDNKLLATNKTIKLKCSKCLTTKSIIHTAAKRRVVRSRPGWQQLTQYCSVRYCTDQRCLIVRMWDHQMLNLFLIGCNALFTILTNHVDTIEMMAADVLVC